MCKEYAARIKTQLPPDCTLGRTVSFLDTVGSTNDWLKERAVWLPHGAAVLADGQTAGRGRMGRTFESPAGEGLYLSVLLRPQWPLEDLTALTPLTAVAVREAVERLCGASPRIKWVNDLLLHGRKLCGILTELGSEEGRPFVVVGVGLNLTQSRAELDACGLPEATSLAAEGIAPPNREDLTAAILTALDAFLHRFPGNKGELLGKYRAACATVGRDVTVTRGEEQTEARALEVGEDFSLRVRRPDGREEWLTAGEVTLHREIEEEWT